MARYYVELGLIAPREAYGESELAELRRVRRLMYDLELEPQAIEIILRMRRRVLALQAELRRFQADLRAAPRWHVPDAIEAEWRDL